MLIQKPNDTRLNLRLLKEQLGERLTIVQEAYTETKLIRGEETVIYHPYILAVRDDDPEAARIIDNHSPEKTDAEENVARFTDRQVTRSWVLEQIDVLRQELSRR